MGTVSHHPEAGVASVLVRLVALLHGDYGLVLHHIRDSQTRFSCHRNRRGRLEKKNGKDERPTSKHVDTATYWFHSQFSSGRRIQERSSNVLAVWWSCARGRRILLHCCHFGLCEASLHIPGVSGELFETSCYQGNLKSAKFSCSLKQHYIVANFTLAIHFVSFLTINSVVFKQNE